jgi:hypothetical protein
VNGGRLHRGFQNNSQKFSASLKTFIRVRSTFHHAQMRSEPPLRTNKQKPMQTIKSKTTRDDKKMNRHPKTKTTKAENTKLYSLLIPLTLVRVSRINA